jgi:hypothetical protein
MSLQVINEESEIYAHYDVVLERRSTIGVSVEGPDFSIEDQSQIEAAIHEFVRGELLRQEHARLLESGVPENVLADHSGIPRGLRLDRLADPDREALEEKLRRFVTQMIRDGDDGGGDGGAEEPPRPSSPSIKPFLSASHRIGNSCIQLFVGIPGTMIPLLSALPSPPPERDFILISVLLTTNFFGREFETGDFLTLRVDPAGSFGVRPDQMLVGLASEVGRAVEIEAWNVVRGRLSSVSQSDVNSVPNWMLLMPGCDGTHTLVFRRVSPGPIFGVGLLWGQISHFDHRGFWSLFGGRRLTFTWKFA